MPDQNPAKRHIITIAGKPGSGKSSTSKGVARELGYARYSSGDLFRQMSAEMGLDLLNTNARAEADSSIDERVDQWLRDLYANQDEMVIDSRLAWHWMPASFKVYLNLDMQVAAERIIATTDPERLKAEAIPSDPAEYTEQLQARYASEAKRYEELYQANPYDVGNYDLVIDTNANDIAQTTALVVEGFRRWINS